MQNNENTSTKPHHDAPRPPWRQFVLETLVGLGGEANLHALYAAIEERAHPSWLSPTWKAKVRQQVQLHPRIERVSKGVWRITPPGDDS